MVQSNRRGFLAGAAGAMAMGLLAGTETAAAQRGGSTAKTGDRDLLVVVDVQNDFIPGGALPVKEGDQIVPLVNKIAASFKHVILTQDWHTPGHTSFASSHPGKKPFETVKLGYGTQVLWPDHCVQGTPGADFHKDLKIPHAELIIRKGYRQHMDSYSAFFEADGKATTGLTGYVRDRGFKNLYFVGLATDFCVGWSALDARKVGLQASVIEDACRGIDTEGSLARAWAQMQKAGVKRIQSTALPT
jgi:nicotinamidase/pyrazinamidase